MRWVLAAAAVVALLLPGCVSPLAPSSTNDAGVAGKVTSVFERKGLPFVLDDEYSRVLANGTLPILDPLSVLVPVQLDATSLGSAADGSAKVHMGLWLPDVPPGTKVPVIADVGPYYADGDDPATVPAHRLGKFLIENFVPHGYAVAQVSVFGTGESTHCMDLMGLDEQAGVNAAVEWLGTQEWSNGNVGLIGRSYDGSTPWEAATFGNEHLKTIVPISGLTGAYELMWRNGSAETRGPIMHNVVYGQFGMDGASVDPFAILGGDVAGAVTADPEQAPGDAYNLCTSYLTGPLHGAAALATGSPATPYWHERSFFERTLKSYHGSVYLIHGLQDWNVDPHVALPRYQQLAEAGLETKALLGQWFHNYPDRASEHEKLTEGRGKEAFPTMTRMDWAQDLLEWFDHYLKGTGPKPALQVEVQENLGRWRVEPTWPPADAAWTEVALKDAKAKQDSTLVTPDAALSFDLPALSDAKDTLVSGLPQLHVQVTPLGPGGQLYALLSDAQTGIHLGHAIMDLRYAAGGNEMQPVVPGQPLVAKMELEPLDVRLPAGHGLRITFAYTGEDYLPPATTAPVLLDLAGSVLRLPVLERGPEAYFEPPNAVGEAKGDTPEM